MPYVTYSKVLRTMYDVCEAMHPRTLASPPVLYHMLHL